MRKEFRLDEFGVDLCALAREGRLDPVAARPGIVEAMLLVLARRTKRCPVLVGEPGVGKSALVEGLAIDFARGAVPGALHGYTLFSLDLGALLAGTSYRGDFEERLHALLAALRDPASPRILFIDEIHLLERAGRSEGGLDAANLLKPLLARGALPCIGATTPSEWAGLVERDPALERRFQVVHVPEPTRGESLDVLRALRSKLEEHHGVTITDAALDRALDAPPASTGGRPRALPDRAIDCLDAACARRVLGRAPRTAAVDRLADDPAFAFDFERLAWHRCELRRAGRGERLCVDADHVRAVAELL